MTGRLVELRTDGPVATITLNRPERHNSLVPELLEQLLGALRAAERELDIRAVVLAANGKSFSTGGDVGEFHARRGQLAAYAGHIVGLLNEVILAMLSNRLPIVAAVHSMVTGGSLGLVLASDVVLVTASASFTPWYTVVGFSPDGGWTAMLPDAIGHTRAASVLLENSTISAHDAVDWGLATRIVPDTALAGEAQQAAAALAAMRPQAIASAKRLVWDDLDRVAAALDDERSAFVTQILTQEAWLGMERFLGVAADD